MDFNIIFINQACLVEMPNKFTINEAIDFKSHLKSICNQTPKSKKIILDFGKTIFIDSSGIGALFVLIKTAHKAQINVEYWSLNPEIKYIFSLAGAEKIFPMVAGTNSVLIEDEALKLLDKPKNDLTAIHPSVISPIKRLIDIIGSIIGLGITSILFIPIAIAIKLDGGSIFCRQVYRGYLGRPFLLWKFRSTVEDTQLPDLVKNEVSELILQKQSDSHLTSVGRFIRKTSLDKLPQFWNVLKGDMSLVGTHPPTYEEVQLYRLSDWQRFNVKPGITGEWQVNGGSKIQDFDKVIDLDLHYQKSWSIGYDIKLIVKTIPIFLSKQLP